MWSEAVVRCSSDHKPCKIQWLHLHTWQFIQPVRKKHNQRKTPFNREEVARERHKGITHTASTEAVTFWWLGDSSRCCFIFSSFSTISLIFMFTCSNKDASGEHRQTNAQMQTLTLMPGSYLVDPKDHSVLQVKRQLLGGTEVGETLDARHHLLYADHLHYIGHHQGIDKVDVGALQKQCYIGNVIMDLAGGIIKMTFPSSCHHK